MIDSGVLPIKESLCHLGSLWSNVRNDMVSAEKRTKKFYAAVNAVVCRLRGASREEDVWKKVLDVQLFPVLSYGTVASLWGTLEGPLPLQNFGVWSQSSSRRSFTL